MRTQKLGQGTAPNICADSTEVEVCVMLLSIKRCWITISSLSTLWDTESAACYLVGPFNYGITQVLSIKGKQHLTNKMQNLQTLKLTACRMSIEKSEVEGQAIGKTTICFQRPAAWNRKKYTNRASFKGLPLSPKFSATSPLTWLLKCHCLDQKVNGWRAPSLLRLLCKLPKEYG